MRYEIVAKGGVQSRVWFLFFLRFKAAGGALAALMILKLQLVLRFFDYG
jgi:hypothetical protein|tara:strand:- start:1281 stop:1427 length:147 start_codon:yes stop_codon:yes gene_type:complete